MSNRAGGRTAEIDQKSGEPCKQIVSSGEDLHVGPGIEVLFHRQKVNLSAGAPALELATIGISFPPHLAKQAPIARTEADQVTAPAVIRPEHKFSRGELDKSPFHIWRAKCRAIPSDRNDLVVSELRNLFDRIFKTCAETSARLPRGGAEMHVNPGGELGRNGRRVQKLASFFREGTPREIDVHFVSEHKESSTRHAF